MSLDDLPYSLVITVSILSAFISNLLRPGGQSGLVADLTQNLLTFSPVVSAVAAVETLIAFIGWRTSRIADTHSALYIIGRLYFDARLPGKKRLPEPSSWRSIGRRGFLLVVTLPSYIVLLKIDGSRWTKFFLACLVTDSVLVDVFLSYMSRSSEAIWLHRDWPAHTFLRMGDVSGLALPPYNSQALGSAVHRPHAHLDTGGQKPKIGPQPRSFNSEIDSYGLCEIFEYLWTTNPESSSEVSAAPRDMDNHSKTFIVLNHFPQGWKCSHYRCLAYYLSKLAQQFLIKLKRPGEMLWITWLLHRSIQPLAILLAHFILLNRPSGFLFNIFKFMVFHVADWCGLVFPTVIFYQILNVIPGFNIIKQWFWATPRICQWAVYGIYVLGCIIVFLNVLRPMIVQEAVMPYVLEATMSPIVLLVTHAAWRCITRLLLPSKASVSQSLP